MIMRSSLLLMNELPAEGQEMEMRTVQDLENAVLDIAKQLGVTLRFSMLSHGPSATITYERELAQNERGKLNQQIRAALHRKHDLPQMALFIGHEDEFSGLEGDAA